MPNIKPILDIRNDRAVLYTVIVGAPVYLTKNGRGCFPIMDMQEQEKARIMGLRGLDDSLEGIVAFLTRTPATNLVAIKNEELIGTILCGHNRRRGYIYHTDVKEKLPQSGNCDQTD